MIKYNTLIGIYRYSHIYIGIEIIHFSLLHTSIYHFRHAFENVLCIYTSILKINVRIDNFYVFITKSLKRK